MVAARLVALMALAATTGGCADVKKAARLRNGRQYFAATGGATRTNGGEWDAAGAVAYHRALKALFHPGGEVLAQSNRVEPALGLEVDAVGIVQLGFHGGYGFGFDDGGPDAAFGTVSVRTPVTQDGWHLRNHKFPFLPRRRTYLDPNFQWGFDLGATYTMRAGGLPDAWFLSITLRLSPEHETPTPPVAFPPDQQ
jgi:hypothetical protein